MLQSSILLLLALRLACVNGYECPEENKEEVDRDGFFHEVRPNIPRNQYRAS
jgi:hypothetical protein